MDENFKQYVEIITVYIRYKIFKCDLLGKNNAILK